MAHHQQLLQQPPVRSDIKKAARSLLDLLSPLLALDCKHVEQRINGR